MKKIISLLGILIIVKAAFSQCSVNVTGGDFAWCTPCQGSASANVSGGTAPYTYNWSNGDTTAFISGLCAGTYSVTITDSMGCTTTDSIIISQIGVPMTVSTNSTAPSCPTCCDICINTLPLGGCLPYSYSWIPNDPNWPSPCIACASQIYTVTVTDACGCSVTDSITTDTVAVTTSINTLSALDVYNVIIYPNPSSNTISVKHNILDENVVIQIINLNGEISKTFPLRNKAYNYNVKELSSGLYLIRILSEQKIYYQSKLIKK